MKTARFIIIFTILIFVFIFTASAAYASAINKPEDTLNAPVAAGGVALPLYGSSNGSAIVGYPSSDFYTKYMHPAPTPAPYAAPQPTLQPIPQPTLQPIPQPTLQPMHQPTLQPTPSSSSAPASSLSPYASSLPSYMQAAAQAGTTALLPAAATPAAADDALYGHMPPFAGDSQPISAKTSIEAQIFERLIKRIESIMKNEQPDQSEPAADTPETATDAPDVPPAQAQPDAAGGIPEGEQPAELQAGISGIVLINITMPNSAEIEIVYQNKYTICGVRDEKDETDEPIMLYLTRYNAESGRYAEVADVDGEACWTVGANGIFTRSILLEEGENKLAIAACKADVIEAAKTDGRAIEDNEIQVETFTILYRSQNVAEKISEVFKELTIANILKEIENH